MSDGDQPRKPQNIYRTAEDSISVSESVHAQVAQAQALIATARGEANDARIRVEEFAASAASPEERDAASQMLAILERQDQRLESIDETLKGLRTEAKDGGYKSDRINIIMGGGQWVLGGLAILVAILIAIRYIQG